MKRSDRQMLTRLRLTNQLVARAVLHGAGVRGAESRSPGGIAGVVRHVTALQAQDLPGAKWSLGLRMPGGTVADVDAALASGSVVRSWPFRGTLHFVLGEDLGWMLDLTGPRMVAAAAGRHRQLELDPAAFERAREAAVAELSGGRSLTRDGLFEVFERAGISTAGQRGVHLLNNLSQTKTLCLGPMLGAGQAVVLLDEWVPRPRVLTREQSLAELAVRYFTSHGPATAKDLQWWSGLLGREITEALSLAGDAIEPLVVDEVTYWVAAGVPDAADVPRAAGATDAAGATNAAGTTDAADVPRAAGTTDPAGATNAADTPGTAGAMDAAGATNAAGAPDAAGAPNAARATDAAVSRSSGVHLLPGFDEYLLGYTDRSAALEPAYSDLIVPGANGMFLPSIVADGRVVGAWKRRSTSRAVTLTAEFFEAVPASVRAGVRREASAYAAHLGLPLASLTFADE